MKTMRHLLILYLTWRLMQIAHLMATCPCLPVSVPQTRGRAPAHLSSLEPISPSAAPRPPGQAPSTAPPFTSPVTSCAPCPAAVLSSLTLHSGKPPRPPVGVKCPPHTLGETLGHCPLCAIIVWFMSAPHRTVTTTALERMPDSRYPMS